MHKKASPFGEAFSLNKIMTNDYASCTLVALSPFLPSLSS